MKWILLVILLLIPATSYPGHGSYYNRNGGYAGGWEGDGQHLEFHDRNGSYSGGADRDNNGWTFRDKNGDYVGGSSESPGINPFPKNDEDE